MIFCLSPFRRLLPFLIFLLAWTSVFPAAAQPERREVVTFRYEGVPPGGSAVFLSGSLPELGNLNLGKSVLLIEVASGVWEVDVSLPVNRTHNYRFFSRSLNATQTPDPAYGTALGPVLSGSTATATLVPATKQLSWRGSLTNPVLHWRQAGTGPFAALALTQNGGWWSSGAFGEANRNLEFYITGDSGRDPAALGGDPADDPFYTTPMDEVFVQDGQIHVYAPAPVVSAPRRDYLPSAPPAFASSFLNQNRSYRVLLPRGYDEHPDRYYPVVYFPNGQNLFDPDTTVFGSMATPLPALDPDGAAISSLIASGLMHEVILVGIDARNTADIISINDPYFSNNGLIGTFRSNYADFVRFELMPLIQDRYRTLRGAANTALAGHGTAAAVSLQLAWDFPAVFGKAALFSMGHRPGLNSIVAADPWRKVRLYLDGTGNNFFDTLEVRELLLGKAATRFVHEGDLRYQLSPGPETFAAAVTRFAHAFPFLFTTAEPLDTSAAQAANPFWLRHFGLASADWDLDNDGDGWTTRMEYAFGTSPVDADDYPILNVEVTGGEALFFWQSRPGVNYQIQRSTDLAGWHPFGDAIRGTGEALEGAVPLAGATGRFFLRLGAAPPVDTDLDGLSDIEEGVILGTDFTNPDTDRDGFDDGAEVLVMATDPLVPNRSAGSIAGRVVLDANGDGNLTGDTVIAGATVFLDLNYNRQHDAGEPSQITGSDGRYQFTGLAPGGYHVIQAVPPGSVQTAPGGPPGQPDGFPDTLVSFNHVPLPGYPVPHGILAAEDHGIPGPAFPGPPFEPVDPALVLKPIGNRNRAFGLGVFNTTEYVSLTKDSEITVSFDDEQIVDGPGFDFQIVSTDSSQNAGEQVEVFAGAALDGMISLGIRDQIGFVGIDLARSGITSPVRYVRLRSLNSAGGSPGYDLVGFQAIHFVPVSPEVHYVDVGPGEAVANIDFGRFGRDLPPRVFLSNGSSTPNAGESVSVQVSASDDFGIASLTLTSDGAAVALDGEGRASIPAPFPGELLLTATATDSAGQTARQDLLVSVRNSDGSDPAMPNSPSLEERIAGAPAITIHSPGAGSAADGPVQVVASIAHANLSSWQLHYAPADAIDPYDLAAGDPDYILAGEGSANVIHAALGTLPADSLADGLYFIRVSATGNSLTAFSGHVIAVRTDPSTLRPVINITSPVAESAAPFLTSVIGSISSTRPVREWFVESAPLEQVNLQNLAAASNAGFTRLAEGSGPVAAGTTMAVFDPTRLVNGSYFLKVTAWNDLGLGWTDGVVVHVTGENKPGRLRLEFDDLQIDLAGLPLRIRRIYDSLESTASGDFGYGWSLAFSDPDIRDTDPDGGAAFSVNAWKPGTRIYLNAPDGRRIGFTFGMEVASSGLIGTYHRATFTGDPGVTETLSVPEGDAGFLTQSADGRAAIAFVGLPWNPDVFILTTREGTRYTYHETGGLLDVEDRAGNTLISTREGIRHTSGASVTFTRDTAGRITSITGPDGGSWTYGYNAAGDLVSVMDPSGTAGTLTYLANPAHYLNTVTDPMGRTGRRFEYDADGRLSAVIDQNGNRSEHSWNLGGFSGTLTDFRGNVTTLNYDARGNVVREERPGGAVTTFAYNDPAHPDRETHITDPRGHLTRYEYDARGNVTRLIPPLGGHTTATYNEFNRPVTLQIPGYNNQTFSYGPRGELLKHEGVGGVREFTHTANGQLSSWMDQAGNTNRLYYGGRFGKLDRVENQNGGSGSVLYQENGLFQSLQGNFGQISFTYDAAGRPLTETDQLGHTITYTYMNGSPFSSTDETGVVRTTMSNVAGLPVMTSTGGAGISYAYDADSNRTSVTDPLGQITTTTWDHRNQATIVASPGGGTTSHAYDLSGNRIQTIDRLGRKRSFVFDAMNRLTGEHWHAPGDDSVIRTISFTYGTDHRLATVVDGDVRYDIGAFNSDEITQLGVTFPGIPRRDLNYLYQERNRVIRTSLGVLTYHDYRRDAAGNATVLVFTTPEPSITAQVQLLRHPNRSIREIRRFSTFNANPASLLSTSDINYNHRGRIAALTHRDGAGLALPDRGILSYGHNARGQVNSLTEGTATTSVTYNHRGEIASVTPPTGPALLYPFDAGGNPSGPGYSLSPGHRLETAPGFEFDWDAEGNLVQRRNTDTGEITDFTWDYRNRLTRVESRPSAGAAATSTVDYRYDYRDLRIARTENGVTVWTLYGKDQMPHSEYTGTDATPTAIFYYDPDRSDRYLAEWRAGVGLRWFLTDQIGSVRTVLDSAGNITATRNYDAFGALTQTTGAAAVAGSPGFEGRPWDPAAGLLYLRARHYDPVMRRFISEDPIGFDSGEINFYRYAKNDPLNFIDPGGTTVSIEYAMSIAEKVDALCNAAGIGQRLDECFTGIAQALSDPFGYGGSNASCIHFPLPGPLIYPIPGFSSIGPPGGGGGGSAGIPSCPSP